MLFVKQYKINIQNQKPQKNVIKLINRLYDEGYYIKILTADILVDLMMISKK